MKHLTQYVLVYPLGQLPPTVRPEDIPDDEPMGQFEEYVFEFSGQPPSARAVHQLNQRSWQIAAVHTYTPLKSTPGPTQAVYVAVCTPNGKIPQQQGWDGKPPILYVPALLNGQLALNDDGSHHFGAAEETPLNIPISNIFADWEVQYCQTFEPDWHPTAYTQVVICWCTAPALELQAV